MVSHSQFAKFLLWAYCDCFGIVWEQIGGHYLLSWSAGLTLSFFGSLWLRATGTLKRPRRPPLVLESSGDTWESLKTSWALFAKDSRTTMRPLALSISYPSDFLLGHSRKKHEVHTDCHQLCVFCPDTHSSRSHFPVCKTDVPWFLWSACCHTVLSCLASLFFCLFLFPWECSGSLNCLFICDCTKVLSLM